MSRSWIDVDAAGQRQAEQRVELDRFRRRVADEVEPGCVEPLAPERGSIEPQAKPLTPPGPTGVPFAVNGSPAAFRG